MIAGVSYNVFNGEEHLLHSLRAIRNCVDYINLVVQFISNTGHAASGALEDVLHQIQSEKLIDAMHPYRPNLDLPPVHNEHAKRCIGLDLAKSAGVTHFMTMDCDEYYVANEFTAAKDYIDQHRIAACAVPSYLHIKRPIWRSKVPDATCCAFLTKIDETSQLIFGSQYPVPVDPTRRLYGEATPFHFFDPGVIAMRHMNLVRQDRLHSKLLNTSSVDATEFLESVRIAYDEWQFGKTFMIPNKPPMDIIEVEDLFAIDRYFRTT